MRFVAFVIRILARLLSLFPIRNRVAFLSRQSTCPFDFVLIESRVRLTHPDVEIAWSCLPRSGRFGPATMLRQLWFAATSRVCIVDGYVPAVSIPEGLLRARCIQVWHAPGAIKKFGYQAVGTSSGRSPEASRAFRMHRGYDCVVAGFRGALAAFAEAFDCAENAIVPCGLPRFEYLLRPEYEELREYHELQVRRVLADQNCDFGGVCFYMPRPSDARLVIHAG